MTGEELRTALRALSHDDLVAMLMRLCSGAYPRIARDSVLAELERRTPEPDPRIAALQAKLAGLRAPTATIATTGRNP